MSCTSRACSSRCRGGMATCCACSRLSRLRTPSSISSSPTFVRPCRTSADADAGPTFMPNLFALRKLLDRAIHPLVATLAELPIHANAWTMFGALLGLIGGVLFFYAYWWTGFVILVVRGLV